MPVANRVSKKSERGSAMVEFALAMAFLAPILAGAFSIGASLVKSIQAGQVCRDANVLVVRGINMAQPDNQQLVIKAAQGMGMNVAGSYAPDPNGKGVIVLSRVYRVSDTDCLAQGKQPNQSSCPNWDQYVITTRIVIGNTSLLTSTIGTPADAPDSSGNIPDTEYVLNTGDRAAGFPDPGITSPPATPPPGLLYLNPGGFTYVAETAFDISSLNLFSIFRTPKLFARNVS